MPEFLLNTAGSTWEMLVNSAFLLLIGLLLAGVVSVFLSSERFSRFLRGSARSQVWRAALFGVPLPLCSCSVLPVAHQLRKSGISRAGTVSFLIATPESGIDSILLTYTLTDPIMTIARPVTAFLTAFTAGHLESAFGSSPDVGGESEDEIACGDHCDCGPAPSDAAGVSFRRIIGGFKYALTDLLDDLAPYLLLGYILAGLVTVLLTMGDLGRLTAMVSGWKGYVAAIVIGLPLYICATSSTPMAAAMLAGGFAPGAVLVFMMVGPATNAASLVVVSKIIRGASLLRYLLSILVVSILCGVILDYLYQLWPQDHWGATGVGEAASPLDVGAAVVLGALILYHTIRALISRLRRGR